tara:strand:- start:5746 stop:6726 length:981 start_codon:yes stop_codon:yes gene_type:complete
MKLNVALIGVGVWGNNFLRLIKNNNDKFQLVATVDPSKTYENEKNHFENIEDLLNSKIDFDSAIVTTPAITHFSIVEKLLKAKKNCLVEKPLTVNSDETRKLFNLSDENGADLLVDHTFLYDPALLYIKNQLENNALGELLHISFERTNFGPIRSDVNANWDIATHDISILSSIFKYLPKNIKSSGISTVNNEFEDIVSTSMFYDNVFVTLLTSWLHPEKTRKIKIVGSEKMLVWDNMSFDEEIKIFDKSVLNDSDNNQGLYKNIRHTRNGSVIIPYIKKEEPLRNVIMDFYNLVSKKEKNKINTKDLTIRTIETMEMIEESLNKN